MPRSASDRRIRGLLWLLTCDGVGESLRNGSMEEDSGHLAEIRGDGERAMTCQRPTTNVHLTYSVREMM